MEVAKVQQQLARSRERESYSSWSNVDFQTNKILNRNIQKKEWIILAVVLKIPTFFGTGFPRGDSPLIVEGNNSQF